MQGLNSILCALAHDMEALADAYLLGQVPAPVTNRRPQLEALHWDAAEADALDAGHMLARGLANRIGNLSDEALRLSAMARGTAQPDIALIRRNWQMFVSTTAWSWRPFVSILRWDAPPFRHAVRAALAIGFAYGMSLVLPWGTHDYWILLTIVVVLRGSLAQTLERRNSRVAGTLIGCLLAGLILAMHAPMFVLLLLLTFAQAIAHALAVRRYLITAIAATVLGLVQAHLVNVGASPVFAVLERVADTLLGVSIAWAFSYVLPSWERHQIASLVARAQAAQARYATLSLTLGQVEPMEGSPELAWRLARRESFDLLSALVQATQRALAEPRAVQPPLDVLGRILARSYQFLGQLTSIKMLLTVRRSRLELERIAPALVQTAQTINATFSHNAMLTPEPLESGDFATAEQSLGDPFEGDLTPWLLRRLRLLRAISGQLAAEIRAFKVDRTR